MSSQKLFQLTKDATIPISLSLLFALVLGVWALAVRVTRWEAKLNSVWSFEMERETWADVKQSNPTFIAPNVKRIWQEELSK